MLCCPVSVLFSGERCTLDEIKFIVKKWYKIDHNALLRTVHDSISSLDPEKQVLFRSDTTQGCSKNEEI